MTDPWTERLSEYLDGDLPEPDRRELERHLEGCAGCTVTLAGLRRVVERARALPPAPPAPEMWSGIAARLLLTAQDRVEPAAPAHPAPRSVPGPRVTRGGAGRGWWSRPLAITIPQALAASLLLVALSGGGMWALLHRAPAAGRAPDLAERAPTARAPGAPAGLAAPRVTRLASGSAEDQVLASVDPRYDRTIGDLQRVLAAERSHLDTSTVRILETNLAIIDRAVAEARHAVDVDPSNPYLRTHLASTMKRKVDLLRRATLLAGAQG